MIVSFLLSVCQVLLSFLSVVLHGTETDGGQDQPNKNMQTPVFCRAVEGRHILSVSLLVVEKRIIKRICLLLSGGLEDSTAKPIREKAMAESGEAW